jgi:hypothetical protein
MDHSLSRYLNDHLAGSSGALLLIQDICENHDIPEAIEFFRDLKRKVSDDRALLEDLLKRIEREPSLLMKAAGGVAARVGGLKLMWEKVEPGQLGMFEALELLAIGIQGKRLLWLALSEISLWFEEWEGIDFRQLELEAIEQRDGVEAWRTEAASDALVSPERKIGHSSH